MRRIRLTETQIADTRATLWRFTDQYLGTVPRSRKLLPL
jgi:hypothetical protein